MVRIVKAVTGGLLGGLMMLTAAVPDFTVEPGLTVEVGEAVYMDASITTDTSPIYNGRFEWDFGDGTVMKYASPHSYNMDSGIALIHYFMAPGTYTVTVDYTSAGGGTSMVTKQITVTGEAPVTGFELWHAPFHARTAQYIYAQIPAAYRNGTARLKLSVIGDNGHTSVLFDKSGLAREEKVVLKNADLPSGNYALQGELLDGSGSRISIWRDKFSKPYDGAPTVGINENNAFIRNGEPFFPVTPWMLNHAHFGTWGHRWMNTAYVTGWFASHDKTTWHQYLDACGADDLAAIGPGGPGHTWDHDVNTQTRRNASMEKMKQFVDHNKTQDAMLAWMWEDEPNLGGRNEKVPSPVLSAWTHVTHKADPLRPVTTQMYGFDYLPYTIGDSPSYNGWYYTDTYDYLYNARMYGGKKHFPCDVSGQDIYPLAFREHTRMQDPVRGPIELWVAAMNAQMERNYHLIPFMQFLETTQLYEHYPDGPTASQLTMEAWLSVVHGAKGINWFHLFTPTPADNFRAMEKFLTQITDLKDIVLGPETDRTVTDNADTRGNRVDFMVRETADSLYLFAVRLTDVKTTEAAEISVTFTLDGVYDQDVNVYDESRTVSMNGGIFIDTFARDAVHIYRIAKPSGISGTGRIPVLNLNRIPAGFRLLDLRGQSVTGPGMQPYGLYFAEDPETGAYQKVIITE